MEILVDPRNAPSVRVAEAAGYTREGLLRAYRPSRDGGRLDLAIYARFARRLTRRGRAYFRQSSSEPAAAIAAYACVTPSV